MVLSAKLHPAHDGSTAIFSPSMARIAASTAKDWSYVDSWLASKFPDSHTLPKFERNSSTLKELLAMASMNERADDSRHLLADAEKLALGEKCHLDGCLDDDMADDLPCFRMASGIREHILSAISAHLDQDGKIALDAIGDAAVEHGTSLPRLEALSSQLIALQTTLVETSQASLRAEIWKNFICREAKKTTDWLATIQSQNYQLPPELAKQNFDLQRKTKAFIVHLSDTQERMATCITRGKGSDPTIQLVAEEEEQFLAVLSHKKDLDAQLMVFEGLPSDTNKARDEVDTLRQKLRGFTSRRDEVFESLVEQASPVKRRP